MKARHLVLVGLASLLSAQALAWWAWQDRPVVHGQRSGAIEVASVGEIFNELEAGEFAGTLLLGGMRGLVIDLLWLRASRASEAGRYYESVALYELISKVQPRFEIVWNHIAWHMAYNIAVEMETVDEKWSWYLAGVEANATGARRNPQSARILEHLAWMLFHKGQKYPDRVEAHDWRPLLAPVLARFGREDAVAPGANNFDLGEAVYRCAFDVSLRRRLDRPIFVLRMIPIAVEQSGNRHRNCRRYLQALRTYLRGIRTWQWVLATLEDPAIDVDPLQREISRDSFERNEGRLRRKAAHLARMLAPDAARGEALAAAIMDRDLDRADELLAQGEWQQRGRHGVSVRWYDEEPPAP